MTSFSKYDTVVVKFPFASSKKYKARPAVIISSNFYNDNSRDTLLIMAISSQIDNSLDFEYPLRDWESSGLLKPSVFKSSIATIEQEYVIQKLGTLSELDKKKLDITLEEIC